jgi:ZIP family zinc transporter
MSPFVAIIPFFSTMIGGLATLRLRHRLHPFMALAAGLLVATALVDLLPEAINLLGATNGPILAGAAAIGGFLAYNALELLVHRGSLEHVEPSAPRGSRPLALLAPAGLIVHSGLDGLAIGTGYAASPSIGLLVLLAVIAHDFADGMNVVTLGLAGGAPRRMVAVLLAVDALAPVAGFFVAGLLNVGPIALGIGLGVFAGAFLSISTGHLLPEARHHQEGSGWQLWLLLAAGAVFALAVRLAAGG